LAKAGDLVDMEGFAVAEECRTLGIPCRLIKGVTDFGDHDGKEDIRTHLGPVSENVAEVVLRILSSVRSLSDARSLQWELKYRAGCARPAAGAQPPLYWGIQKQDCSGTMGDAFGAPLRVAREDTRHFDLGAERVNVPAGIVTDSAPKAVTPSDAVHGPPVNPASGGPAAGALLPKLLRFTRVEHTLFSLPLLFAGAWLGADGHCPPLRTLALIALVGTGARTFGMAVNRIVDRDLDAENPRTAQRELPAGRLSLWQAYVVAAAGMAAYLLGCAWLGPTVLKLSLVPIVPLALYSFLKRFTSLCHYGIGLCLALAPLGAYVAVTGGLAFSPQVIGLAVFTFGWMSGFDIIYALLDVEFDRAHGVRSLPAAVGPVRAQWIAAMTHLISAAALIRLWYDGAGMMSGLALLVALGALGAAYWQRLPVSFRFFPVSVIAGMAGALVVLLERFP
jgi:4-hydroxybenzoate polyprenyltransferase